MMPRSDTFFRDEIESGVTLRLDLENRNEGYQQVTADIGIRIQSLHFGFNFQVWVCFFVRTDSGPVDLAQASSHGLHVLFQGTIRTKMVSSTAILCSIGPIAKTAFLGKCAGSTSCSTPVVVAIVRLHAQRKCDLPTGWRPVLP